ncbi:hypothetical protein GLE_3029 [Lysobacter enzymogenes]|uniref:Uncharacterized protein n=1 Tax=Lysobacter enzymogenes TaxID=69 RepID=A0A0S2DJC0_LYSEN|nr:hypothetical protein GLE_3029 [Lysobacter enzymogenes]
MRCFGGCGFSGRDLGGCDLGGYGLRRRGRVGHGPGVRVGQVGAHARALRETAPARARKLTAAAARRDEGTKTMAGVAGKSIGGGWRPASRPADRGGN